MDKDKVGDLGHEVKGDIKEAAGISTGDKDRGRAGKSEKSLEPSARKPADLDDDILNMPKE